MKILVTGGNGFLGSHVVRKLRERGRDEVIAPSSKQYDLTSYTDTARCYAAIRPNAVIHLAASVGGILANQSSPGRFMYENLMMGAHMLEVGRMAHLEKFVLIGTTCSYPKHAPQPMRETDLWNGYPEETNAPYGLAKRVLVTQAQAYRKQYGLHAISLISANLYGPGDNVDPESSHVIPALIRKFSDAVRGGHKEVVVWGTGTATRDFLYVEDCATGILAAMDFYGGNDPVNLGTGVETSILSLARTIAALTGFQGSIRFDPSKPDGQPRRVLDTERAFNEFNFRASTQLKDGLRKTVEWYTKLTNEKFLHAVR